MVYKGLQKWTHSAAIIVKLSTKQEVAAVTSGQVCVVQKYVDIGNFEGLVHCKRHDHDAVPCLERVPAILDHDNIVLHHLEQGVFMPRATE